MLRTTEKSGSISDYVKKMFLSSSASRQILDFTQPTTYLGLPFQGQVSGLRSWQNTSIQYTASDFLCRCINYFFRVIPRRLSFMCRRFGTLCSIFIGGLSKKNKAKVWNHKCVTDIHFPILFSGIVKIRELLASLT